MEISVVGARFHLHFVARKKVRLILLNLLRLCWFYAIGLVVPVDFYLVIVLFVYMCCFSSTAALFFIFVSPHVKYLVVIC